MSEPDKQESAVEPRALVITTLMSMYSLMDIYQQWLLQLLLVMGLLCSCIADKLQSTQLIRTEV